MKPHSYLFLLAFIVSQTYHQVSCKPFYWGDTLYLTTSQPIYKYVFNRVNHWFKNLIDAYPSSTWSWREHLYGETYWKDPEVKKAWFYKGIVDDRLRRNSPRRVIFDQYDRERYENPKPTKPGVVEYDEDEEISKLRIHKMFPQG
uniref:Uncharacterized protein n=1 Tax=Cacopsylla melanoneura TaxID=428564 RepID=A0A8D8X6J6_9HEMI